MTDATQWFAHTVPQAHATFLAAAVRAGVEVEEVWHPLTGPDGEPICSAVAELGPPDASNVLLVLSGIHGIEGYFGSALQCHALAHHDEVLTLPADTKAVFIHLVNPWGTAWSSRENEDNVELLRGNYYCHHPKPANPIFTDFFETMGYRSITSIDDEAMALELLETSLADQVKEGRHPVLVIDEAQVLESHGLLEPVRLLMNLATQAGAGQAALTLILVGQPALTAHLQRHSALEERIAVRCMLPQWSDGETHAYMSHRMRWAGAPLERIFGEDAIDRICELSHGIPRLINRLADLALMVGYGEEVAQIDRRLIDSLQEEMSLPAGAEG